MTALEYVEPTMHAETLYEYHGAYQLVSHGMSGNNHDHNQKEQEQCQNFYQCIRVLV